MKTYFEFINETKSDTITLYHGTCLENAKELIKNGWDVGRTGGNLGQSKYLYLSSGYEDAMWFAEEKGCNTVVEIKDIPLDYLLPDPEDEAGYTMSELLNRTGGYPSKYVLTKPLSAKHFSIK